jgi:prophage regulatory protein
MATGDDTDAEAGAGQTAADRLIRLPEVMARVGLRRTAIYQRMREGRFPRSRSLGSRCTVWVEAEIDAWIACVTHRE